MPAQNPREILLSPNFKLGEFLHAEAQLPPTEILDNLHRLANRLQVIRDLLNRPIVINSGYRTPEHNKAVGGAPKSYHLSGMAADIVVSGMPAAEVQAFLKNWSGGLGLYTHYTHVDIRPVRARWGEAYQP
jgi:uncharacterized protein YcbK (DUF882 family)